MASGVTMACRPHRDVRAELRAPGAGEAEVIAYA